MNPKRSSFLLQESFPPLGGMKELINLLLTSGNLLGAPFGPVAPAAANLRFLCPLLAGPTRRQGGGSKKALGEGPVGVWPRGS